jgi:hypothetical protein
MFELVSRRAINTTARYSALQQHDDSSSSEAEADAVAPPRRAVPYTPMHANMRQVHRREADKTTAASTGLCVKVCFIISCAGVVFLCVIGRMLAGDTPYIMLEASEANNSTFAGAVFGAAAMYFLCMCYAGYALCQGWRQRRSPLMDPP